MEHTKCVDEADFDKWQENGGHEVDAETAEQIANQLEHLINSGHAQNYAEQVRKEQEIAEATNKKVEELFEKIRHKVKVATGQELVPNEYPKKYKDEWDKTYELRDSRASYPFNIANVKEFIEFCRNSNGFRIS
jgi:hypothetical protein